MDGLLRHAFYDDSVNIGEHWLIGEKIIDKTKIRFIRAAIWIMLRIFTDDKISCWINCFVALHQIVKLAFINMPDSRQTLLRKKPYSHVNNNTFLFCTGAQLSQIQKCSISRINAKISISNSTLYIEIKSRCEESKRVLLIFSFKCIYFPNKIFWAFWSIT